jgi:hypothetical protein
MKRRIALMLVLTFMMTMFAACADKADKKEEAEAAPALAETVIFDEGGITVTVTALKDSMLGPELAVEIANESDSNIAFVSWECIINGITVGSSSYIEAPAGETTEGSIWFYESDMEMAGIETIATIDCPDASIIDSDSYATLYKTSFELTTTAGKDFEQSVDDSGDVVYKAQGITVISQTYTDDTYGKSVCLLVRNESGKEIALETMDTVINGKEVAAGFYDTIFQDTVRFCTFDLYTAGLEDNGIDKIETIRFSLRLFDENTFDSIAQSETITLTVN